MPSSIQIRLCWVDHVEHHTDVIEFSSQWEDLTVESLKRLELLAHMANGMYGADTHWIEERNGASS